MASAHAHTWAFRTKFRARAFGWKGTRLATRRLREALGEIKRVAKKDPVLAGEGGLLLIERLWPALQMEVTCRTVPRRGPCSRRSASLCPASAGL